MANLALINKVGTVLEQSQLVAADDTAISNDDIALQHTCLAAEYMSHVAAAGYSAPVQVS